MSDLMLGLSMVMSLGAMAAGFSGRDHICFRLLFFSFVAIVTGMLSTLWR